MKTILITGCSSGFGLALARYFLERDWNVVATMRTPRADLLPASGRLRIVALDVTDSASIAAAVEAAGPVDVLVNNAGIGILGAFESMTMETVGEIFATNTLGTMALTQAMLPQFRQRRAGVIVNITSSVTLAPLPLLAVYSASKAAVTAFTESLAHELQPLNIRLRLVLPGRAPGTSFGASARARMHNGVPDAYAGYAQGVFAAMASDGPHTEPIDVAAAVWRAVHDADCPMRLPAGADAIAMAGGV